MPRLFDHLVVCVADLDTARATYQALGFTLTPHADHPFGTRNSLALMQGSFIELLTVARPADVPPPAPGRFSFGAHNQAFLREGEGLSMLSLQGKDAWEDAQAFAADGLGRYDPFDFGRDALMPDGRKVRVGFSLAFAVDPSFADMTFFTCQQHHPPELFWRAEYQRHANGATRISEVILPAEDPPSHRAFMEKLMGTPAALADGELSVGPASDRLVLLDPKRMSERYPETAGASGRVRAARLLVDDLGAMRKQLQRSNVPHRNATESIVVPHTAAHGIVLEFAAA
ncbi:MAG: VOC family protein [Alphaproteobacteria bacterium]|nr:VOC family protein [Alphaproteobacteria bacterium]